MFLNNHFITSSVVFGMALALAGCGASGPSYDSVTSDFEGLLDSVADYEDTVVMPTTGGATYRGYAGFEIDDAAGTSLLSKAVVTADFVGGTVGGNFNSFIDDTDETYSGRVNIVGGTIIGSGFGFDVDGTISGSGGDIDFEGIGEGNFGGPLGVGAEGVAGFAEGTATQTGGPNDFIGFFIAKR